MSKKIRSPFLVHWTGKDIDATSDRSFDELRKEYVLRLLCTLETGLWLTECREIIAGGGLGIYEYNVPMTCFTEIRLSVANEHARKYGRLGFGFDRRFILENGGSPVLYIRQHPKDLLMQRVAGVFGRLDGLMTFLVADGNDSERFWFVRDVDEARELLQQICVLLKPMSKDLGGDDFELLEEAEWRIAYSERWCRNFSEPRYPPFIPSASNALHEHWERPEKIVPSGKERPTFFLKFEADDLRLLIFPDEDTRALTWKEPAFQNWHQKRSTPISMLSLEECQHF